MTLEFHPLANLFPLIEGQAFADLVADVKANGLLDRIVILDGQILDGRNRYRAAVAAGLIAEDYELPSGYWGVAEFAFSLYRIEDRGDPLTWVMSKNLHRRHLDESQRSAVAARLETLTHGGDRHGQDASLQFTRADISKIVNVSPRSIASSKKVLNEGSPELFNAIETGRVKASVAEKLLSLPREKQIEAVTSLDAKRLPTIAKQAMRELTEKRLADKQKALPTRFYGVILADPPWRFEPYSRDTGMDRAADNHYPTQDTAEIKGLPISSIAAPDCALFLWATGAMICDALQVLRFWGFEYKSQFVWVKPSVGTGYWNRNRHEVLLVGTRGNIPAPAPGTQWDSVIEAPAGRHSEKPEQFHQLIESYYPNLPRIELNARAVRPGWDLWGKEAPEPAAASAEELRAAYTAALAASNTAKGKYTRSTAEPIIRAAWAAEIPVMDVVEALGHPKGTINTWSHRLGVTSQERERRTLFGSGGRLNDPAPDQGGDRDV